MHSWEAIQKTLDYIEHHIDEEIQIEALAEMASLSLFYYQRLFARLVKKPVREYIKLRRLARACDALSNKENRILDVAAEYGFRSHETFTRAFKDAYGITPAQYRDKSVVLNSFYKPDLMLDYNMVDEGVPLIMEGLVLEINRKYIEKPINFLGVQDVHAFTKGKMLGERTEVNLPREVWNKFFKNLCHMPHIPCGQWVGVYYQGDAPDGYSTYFVGAEVEKHEADPRFASWQLPAREYVVCSFEAENKNQMFALEGKAMKFTRLWLKKHGLIADGFFPQIYFNDRPDAYQELWIPFRKREQ